MGLRKILSCLRTVLRSCTTSGMAAYWQRCKLEVFAMIRTLGPPTWFITLSADDMNWPDILVLLANEAGMSQVSSENVHALTAMERRKLVAGNTVSVARHFFHRFAVCEAHSKRQCQANR